MRAWGHRLVDRLCDMETFWWDAAFLLIAVIVVAIVAFS